MKFVVALLAAIAMVVSMLLAVTLVGIGTVAPLAHQRTRVPEAAWSTEHQQSDSTKVVFVAVDYNAVVLLGDE